MNYVLHTDVFYLIPPNPGSWCLFGVKFLMNEGKREGEEGGRELHEIDGWMVRVGIPTHIPPISLSLKDTQNFLICIASC